MGEEHAYSAAQGTFTLRGVRRLAMLHVQNQGSRTKIISTASMLSFLSSAHTAEATASDTMHQ